MTDPANYSRWQPSLVRIRPHSRGPLRVGSDGGDGPVPFRGTFALEPSGGGTRLTWTVLTRGAASRLGGPLVGRATRRELEANARRLKEILEADG